MTPLLLGTTPSGGCSSRPWTRQTRTSECLLCFVLCLLLLLLWVVGLRGSGVCLQHTCFVPKPVCETHHTYTHDAAGVAFLSVRGWWSRGVNKHLQAHFPPYFPARLILTVVKLPPSCFPLPPSLPTKHPNQNKTSNNNRFSFDPLDVTKTWPEDVFPLQPVGRMVLNRNPDNFFNENEQLAFCPALVVPGMTEGDREGWRK